MEIMRKRNENQNLKIALTEHFVLSEIACKKDMQICPYCNGELPPYKYWDRMIRTLRILEIVRKHFQDPFAYILITSAYRCKKHNDEISCCENPDLSQHRIFAVDFQVIQFMQDGEKKYVEATMIYDLLNQLISDCIGGIGIINNKTVHFDLRPYNSWRRRKPYEDMEKGK